ncbi:uncharacterized protein CEXT_345841 [Caerostris extrusa]|uniref:Uncharacterized protein n=1 Tax=Caerostris extrusa TaxID=172846 RepID=A0AAV4XWI1_CAEEX|nr:uncharacterized protein CEXT_345841 [Caerostris extrusa]
MKRGNLFWWYNGNRFFPEKSEDKTDSKTEGVSSSWTKQDIKVMFSSMKSHDKPSSSSKYQPCETEEKDLPVNGFKIDEEEVLDTTLAIRTASPTLDDTQMTAVTTLDTSTTEMLDKELTDAVEGIAQTFQPKREFKRHETNL